MNILVKNHVTDSQLQSYDLLKSVRFFWNTLYVRFMPLCLLRPIYIYVFGLPITK